MPARSLGRRGLVALVATALVTGVLTLASAPPAGAAPSAAVQASDPAGPQLTRDLRVPMSDGVELLVRLGGRGPLADGELPPRPVIIEASPYGPGCCAEYGGPGYNYVQVHIRGTGDSDGSFDALGPRSQRDLAEVMEWACAQPWSNGRLGLWGFSASAIVVYNSLHQQLPCLETAVLRSGTHELYRDLLYPGGIPNGVPALGVFALIGAPALALLPDRLARDPLSLLTFSAGMADTAVDYLAHPTLDSWWRARGWRGDANQVPTLVVNGFFDVEARGAFEGYRALRDAGAHLYVVGAHDGVPAGSGGDAAVTRRWFDQHLRDIDTGVLDEPRVQLWMADGDRAAMLSGRHVTYAADDWPVPGTEWVPLYLRPERSRSAPTLNDGSLGLRPARTAAVQPHLPVPSLFTATDAPTTALLGMFNGSPGLTNMDLPQVLGLSYTTAPLAQDVLVAGPASLELVVRRLTFESDLWVVLSDVWPDGSAHPVATGRLRTSYPHIDRSRSLLDADGNVVQPYNVFGRKQFTLPGMERRYFVELWPIGNRFREGHRLRLHVVGSAITQLPTTSLLDLVRLGGAGGGSVLRVPVLPESDLPAALSPSP